MQPWPQHQQLRQQQRNRNNNNNNRHYSPPRSSILLYFISGLVFAMTTTNKLEHLGRKKGKYRSHCCWPGLDWVWPGLGLAWHLAELHHGFALPEFRLSLALAPSACPEGLQGGLTIAHVNILVSSFSTLPCYSSITVPQPSCTFLAVSLSPCCCPFHSAYAHNKDYLHICFGH